MKSYDRIFHITVILLSVLFLFVGSRIASGGTYTTTGTQGPEFTTGVVTQVVEIVEEVDTVFGFVNNYIIFNARLTGGERRGDIVTAIQHLHDFFLDSDRTVEAGDRVVLVFDSLNDNFFFANFTRINYVAILGAVFLALVVLFGRKKGLSAIIALGFTCLAVFLVFIPAILSGRNIYIATIIISCFSIVSTLLIVIGKNKKALSAMLGCFGGVLLAGALMLLMDAVTGLTGVVDHETRNLLFLPTETPVNLRAIIFAGVIIGAVGAIMDVAMSIASSLWEVREAGGVSDFKGIFKSGINIGKDILGTMLNTLILAYIGSSLSLILLLTIHTTSSLEFFSMEFIIVEFLRALVGSFGMLLTIPLTAGICGWLYSRQTDAGEYDDDYFEQLQQRKAQEREQRQKKKQGETATPV